MSDTRKDGARGGAHRNGHRGKEFWKSRLHRGGELLGRVTKRLTHRKERRAAKVCDDCGLLIPCRCLPPTPTEDPKDE